MTFGRSLSASILAVAYRTYYATLRLHLSLPDGTVLTREKDYSSGREIFALCERDALALGGILTGRAFATLVAPGRDGDRATAIIERLGTRVVRGASERGGAAALRGLLRVLRDAPCALGLVVDGPLGPAGRAKPGAARCAIATHRPLRAVSAAARHAVIFRRTWSGIYLPLPFTRVDIVVDDVPIDPACPSDIDRVSMAITEQLTQTRARAVALAGGARW